jgi:hypothetical protein
MRVQTVRLVGVGLPVQEVARIWRYARRRCAAGSGMRLAPVGTAVGLTRSANPELPCDRDEGRSSADGHVDRRRRRYSPNSPTARGRPSSLPAPGQTAVPVHRSAARPGPRNSSPYPPHLDHPLSGPTADGRSVVPLAWCHCGVGVVVLAACQVASTATRTWTAGRHGGEAGGAGLVGGLPSVVAVEDRVDHHPDAGRRRCAWLPAGRKGRTRTSINDHSVGLGSCGRGDGLQAVSGFADDRQANCPPVGRAAPRAWPPRHRRAARVAVGWARLPGWVAGRRRIAPVGPSATGRSASGWRAANRRASPRRSGSVTDRQH